MTKKPEVSSMKACQIKNIISRLFFLLRDTAIIQKLQSLN